mmetsp:Transcript_7287/g.9506  ORF Transcript_7287/g.9506 Transcript_7287/m.9506 type:complete len:348 (-) Transcript_7287:92-1135(-)
MSGNGGDSSDDWSSSSSDEGEYLDLSKNKTSVQEDDDSSDGDAEVQGNRVKKQKPPVFDGASSDDNSDDSGESDDDSDRDSGEELSEDEALPLGERLLRKEESQNSISLKRNKERRTKARKVVAERLTQLEKDKNASSSKNSGNVTKKKSKHAPTEASSKRKDFYNKKRSLNESGIGVEIGAHRYRPRDPRTSSLSGTLDEEHFERNYAFLDDIRKKEMEELKQHITARKLKGTKGNKKRRKLGITGDQGSVEQDTLRLKQMQQENADLDRKQMQRHAKQSLKKTLQHEVETGQRSAKHFLNRQEMKKRLTEAKFEEIRKRGGDSAVDKALAKRRKKNKSRDAKKGI